MRRLLGTTIFLKMDIIDFLTCLTKLDKRKLQTSSFSLGSARHHRSSSVLSVTCYQAGSTVLQPHANSLRVEFHTVGTCYYGLNVGFLTST